MFPQSSSAGVCLSKASTSLHPVRILDWWLPFLLVPLFFAWEGRVLSFLLLRRHDWVVPLHLCCRLLLGHTPATLTMCQLIRLGILEGDVSQSHILTTPIPLLPLFAISFAVVSSIVG